MAAIARHRHILYNSSPSSSSSSTRPRNSGKWNKNRRFARGVHFIWAHLDIRSAEQNEQRREQPELSRIHLAEGGAYSLAWTTYAAISTKVISTFIFLYLTLSFDRHLIQLTGICSLGRRQCHGLLALFRYAAVIACLCRNQQQWPPRNSVALPANNIFNSPALELYFSCTYIWPDIIRYT